MSNYAEIINEDVNKLAGLLVALQATRDASAAGEGNYGYEALRQRMRDEAAILEVNIEISKDLLGIDELNDEIKDAAIAAFEAQANLRRLIHLGSTVAMKRVRALVQAHKQGDLMTFDGTVVRPPSGRKKVTGNDG